MDTPVRNQQNAPIEARQMLMGLLARATKPEFDAAFAVIADAVEVLPVRGPETGLVMVRGRIGGGGDPFNLGEVTVSRATVRLADGTVGHGQRLGTDKELARLAAVFDALFQGETHRGVADALAHTVAARIAQEDRKRDSEAAATRVDFFTLVRGDD